MIYSQLSVEKKKKINRVIYVIGFLFLILGFLPGFISYQWGLIMFVFSLIVAGVIKVVVPEPAPGEHQPLPESDLDKVLKTEDESKIGQSQT